MRAIETSGRQRKKDAQKFQLRRLAIAVPATLTLAFGLASCENVATLTQASLVRVIDASNVAPAANVAVEGDLIAANVGQGNITPYGTVPANTAALIAITAATGGATLVTTSGTLVGGHQHSVFLTDNSTAPNGYAVTLLEDQQIQAASGHSAFRFLNQAPQTGAVDIYMIPQGTTIADAIPLVTNLPVGGIAGYLSFPSQTVTMVITPTGLITPQYTSTPMGLTGGEVRTVLIMDTQLTSNPPVAVTVATDAGPAN